jgi:iron complex transport system ATP-binding protein
VAGGGTAVCLRDVTVEVHGQLLLRCITLEVGRGEHWAVLGSNGSGKTTLLSVVRGSIEPSSGTVTVLGDRLGAPGFRDPRLRIAVVEAAPPLFASRLTAVEVVLLRSAGPVAVRGTQIGEDEIREANELLQQLGCGRLIDREYASCSRGEQQRINLARSLLREPEILLLDEPTAGLDLPGRAAFLDAMQRLATARPSLTSVTASHHVEELPASTTHLALLREGALVRAGSASEVMADYAALSTCFGMPVTAAETGDGWRLRAAGPAW